MLKNESQYDYGRNFMTSSPMEKRVKYNMTAFVAIMLCPHTIGLQRTTKTTAGGFMKEKFMKRKPAFGFMVHTCGRHGTKCQNHFL
jgi:hypothetical protein